MRRLIFVVLTVLTLAVAANAQTFRGAINGTVTDPSGAIVPNANVEATEKATGIKHSTLTTGDGLFAFQDIPLGAYKITVTATGFPPYTVDNVDVSAGTIYTLTVKLSLGQQVSTVEVSAAALALDTTTQMQTTTVTPSTLQDIPLNGRDFSQLITLAPGTGGYNVGGFLSLNGTRANQMNWQIDGVDNNDFWHNIPAVNQGGVSGIAGIILPIDAIDEFSAQTQSGAEAGRNAGGTVNLVLKAGGNDFHGSAYYFNRNEFYAARSPFLPTGQASPKLRNENYGGSVGGPIFKSKTFFLVTFEKQQYIIGLSGLATEPSTLWLRKARTLLDNTGSAFGSYPLVPPSALSAVLLGSSTPGAETISATGFWPGSLIGSLPATLGNFFSPIASTGYSYNGTIKIDHNFTDKHHLSAHWFGGQGNQIAPLGGSPALGTASSNLHDYFEVAPIHVFNYAVVLNSAFSPRLTNQVLVGVNYFNQVFHDFNNSFDTKALGLFLSPDATIKGKPILGAPNIKISGSAGPGGASGGFEQIGLTPPEGRNDITGHLTDIVSYSLGKHQFRFGGEFRQGRVNEFYFRRGTGKFTFDGSQGPWSGATGCGVPTPPAACTALGSPSAQSATFALADYLAGFVEASTISVGNAEREVRVNAFNLYFQDAYQVTRKLNLNFGLRYEYFGPLHNDHKDLAVFVASKGGLVIQGNGIDSIFPPDKNNVAPRLGFAYQPTASGDLVVRGGIGVYYDQINMNPFLDYRPPNAAASGLQGNSAGPTPYSTYSQNLANFSSYTWQANQQVFPGVTTCVTGNVATDPNCGTRIFNVYSVNQNFRTPYFYSYSLQVEKGFGKAGILQIGYVGSEGRKLSVMLNINQHNAFVAQFPNFSNGASINQLNSVGTSNYNSLQTTYRLRSWHGLSSTFAYTWAHALDKVTQYRAVIPLDSDNLKAEYGNGDFDTRHNFTANFNYEVPGSSHGPKFLTHGWKVSSFWVFHTGQPFNIDGGFSRPSSSNLTGFNLTGDPFAGVSHSFSKNLAICSCAGMQWVDATKFVAAPAGSLGNVPRNKFYGPGFGDVDLSVFKTIPIRERFKVQLHADMFNLFNRINLASGGGSVNGDGTVTDTIGDFNGAPGLGPGEQFNIQLAIKIIF